MRDETQCCTSKLISGSTLEDPCPPHAAPKQEDDEWRNQRNHGRQDRHQPKRINWQRDIHRSHHFRELIDCEHLAHRRSEKGSKYDYNNPKCADNEKL